jgi:hypothetical protein
MVIGTQLPTARKVRQALEDVDKRATGKLSRQAFRGALEDMGLNLENTEWRQLLSELDKSDKGYVQYEEFLEWFEGLKRKEGKGGGGGGGRGRREEDEDEESKDDGGRRRKEGGRDSDLKPYDGTRRKRGLAADEAVELTVHSVRLTDKALAKELRGAEVFVSYRLMGDEHETPQEELRDGEVDFNASKTFPAPSGSRALDALAKDLSKGSLSMALCAKEKGRR